MRLSRSSIVSVAISFCLSGQTYNISTIAGGAVPENIPGTSARLGIVDGIALDPAGNTYILLGGYHIVVRQDALTGVLTRVAGNGTLGFSGDNGPATSA